ncbi:MAG: type I-E CRISPR-associated protein Cas7/Cse4/CasC [Rhodospirillales bacterium]
MTTPRFLQIHTLQSYPAVLLNRDDSGLAKRLPFGGATRTRVSSQCLKRHWRTAEDDFAFSHIDGIEFGKRSRLVFLRAILGYLVEKEGHDEKRTREIVTALKDRVFPKSDEEANKYAKENDKKDPLETEQAFLLGEPEIGYLRQLVVRVLTGDQQLWDALNQKPKKGKRTEFQKDLEDNLKALGQSSKLPAGLESALFGRMVTSDLIANTEAAIYVAHAFTVHTEESESDYFTVVDDLKDRASGDDAGSAGIFDMELTSGLFYGYVVVDVPGLVSNLEGCRSEDWLAGSTDRTLAGKVVEHLCHLIAKVSPGAKLGATAPFGWSRLSLIEAGSRQPRSLANAFRKPVPAKDGMEDEARKRLAGEIEKLDAAYGNGEVRRFTSVDDAAIPCGQRLPFDELARWAAAVVRDGQA